MTTLAHAEEETDVTGLNASLLALTLDFVTRHPNNWNQEKWHCGTTGCFAYHALRLSGRPMVFVGTEFSSLDETLGLMAGPADPVEDIQKSESGNFYVEIPDAAALALGLNGKQSFMLFRATNNLDEITDYVHLLLDQYYLRVDRYQKRFIR